MPGPGTYEGKSLEAGRFFTMTGKHRSRTKDERPGPASYNNSKVFKNEGNTVFGTGRRPSLHQTRGKQEVPGPSLYSSQIGCGVSYSFGAKKSF